MSSYTPGDRTSSRFHTNSPNSRTYQAENNPGHSISVCRRNFLLSFLPIWRPFTMRTPTCTPETTHDTGLSPFPVPLSPLNERNPLPPAAPRLCGSGPHLHSVAPAQSSPVPHHVLSYPAVTAASLPTAPAGPRYQQPFPTSLSGSASWSHRSS